MYRALSFLFILVLAYVISTHVGNPFAGLGSSGELTGKSKEYLLNETGFKGFLDYLKKLLSGGGLSLSYRQPSLLLASSFAVSTLLALVPSFALSAVLAAAWVYLFGFACPKPLRALAFVPEYLYALALSLASWYLLWPSPLPGSGPSKVLEYSIVIFLSDFPKLVQALADLLGGREEFREMKAFWKAVGLSERGVRLKVMRTMRAQVISTVFTFMALSLERSVFVEPMIGFTGLGYLLFNSVTKADVTLAASSFILLSALSISILSVASLLEGESGAPAGAA